MTVDEAETLILEFWAYLEKLPGWFPTQPGIVEVRAAARWEVVHGRIIQEMSAGCWRTLYDRLKGRQEVRHVDEAIGDQPILGLLWGLIDLRERLGIRSPRPDKEQLFQQSARRSAGKSMNRSHGANEMGKAS